MRPYYHFNFFKVLTSIVFNLRYIKINSARTIEISATEMSQTNITKTLDFAPSPDRDRINKLMLASITSMDIKILSRVAERKTPHSPIVKRIRDSNKNWFINSFTPPFLPTTPSFSPLVRGASGGIRRSHSFFKKYTAETSEVNIINPPSATKIPYSLKNTLAISLAS